MKLVKKVWGKLFPKPQPKRDELDEEETYLKRLQRVNTLRDEVYKAIEENIRKRLEKAKPSSKKGKINIDEQPTYILGGKSR